MSEMRWPTETLARIAATDDLHVAPFRDDGDAIQVDRPVPEAGKPGADDSVVR